MSTIGLVSLGRLQSLAGGGGGGGALGTATIWNTGNQSPLAYFTWADLANIVNPRDEDEALVINSDGSGTFAFARYSAADGEWGLYLAEFASLTLMQEFPHLIRNNCIVTAGGRTFRRKSVIGPDAVAKSIWVPRSFSESISSFPAFLDGDEADAAARLAHGFTDTISGSATITGDVSGTGYTRLSAPASGTHSAQLQTLIGTMTSSTKVYVRFRIKASPAGAASTGFIGCYTADGANICYPRQGGTTQSYGFQSSGHTLLSPGALRSGGIVLPGSDTWIEFFDEGRTVQSSVYLDGALYHVDKRSSVASGSNLFAFLVGSISAGAVVSADLKDVIVLTYT